MRMKTIPEDEGDPSQTGKFYNDENSITEEKFIDQSINQILEDVSNDEYREIESAFFSVDWDRFFKIWNTSFPLHVKTSSEYRILTLKLRVHYAILPIRILELDQLNDTSLFRFPKAMKLLKIAADEYSIIDNAKEIWDECSDNAMNNMKQLELFLNSYQGQNLILELKGNPIMTLIALPYITHPQDDVSVQEIFSIDWLEDLIRDLEKFMDSVQRCSAISNGTRICSSSQFDAKDSSGSEFTDHDDEYPLAETPKKIIGDCDGKGSIDGTRPFVKRKDIENWIGQGCRAYDISKPHETKCTQTTLSCIKDVSSTDERFNDLERILRNMKPNPSLIDGNLSQSYNDELISTKLRLFSTHQRYRKLKVSFHNLLKDYQKMNEIAEKLTNALENSVRGQSVDLESISQSCMNIFPNRFDKDLHKEIQTDSEDVSLDNERKLYEDELVRGKSEKISDDSQEVSKSLDFDKIKYHLKYGDVKTKLLLLQSLRQKLTLNHTGSVKETVLEYATNDVLGIQQEKLVSDNENILSSILQPSSSKTSFNFIQQMTSRLLNTLASSSHGRNYLASGNQVLNLIVQFLDSCTVWNSDEITLDMLVATLQKMSLRKEQRRYMVDANLVEWLIYHLGDKNFTSRTYRLEYACALLMNMSLQSEAWSRASKIADLFVTTVINLLNTESTSILLYVNGSLQNFLLDDKVNNEAKRLNFAKILNNYLSVKDNKEIRDQIIHTLRIHRRECEEKLLDEDDLPDGDDGVLDAFEDELEEDDPVVFQGEVQGEQFLNLYICRRS
ncbi:hypothetical protein QAD02_014912 [Eretmocerus hayati]|uniref:Uncharacterized protein n=1 Tax=Eretmocerus hayati TaxID=131215 RepID=A0ACC2PBJ9_9HYME|nr:hypothetical protein QAD02_014912 [Eretmocerus hayati]